MTGMFKRPTSTGGLSGGTSTGMLWLIVYTIVFYVCILYYTLTLASLLLVLASLCKHLYCWF